MAQFWYQWCCGFSAQSVFQSWQVSLYNVVFTAFPVLALGILEQDVGKRYSLAYPELYVAGQQVRPADA
jgi:magnesium-transporting ATPase (P-type)